MIFMICSLYSCLNNDNLNPFTVQGIWKDVDTLHINSYGNKVFYIDSSILRRSNKTLTDSTFINSNLEIIDSLLSKSNGFYDFRFTILDTINKINSNYFIVILEQFEDTLLHIDNRAYLKVIIVSKERVLSTFTLAEDDQFETTRTIKSSILFSDNRIISRTVNQLCYHNKPMPCTFRQYTQFYKFDPHFMRFKESRKMHIRFKDLFN
jgi:hypothetical protein